MHFENCADIDGFLKLGHNYIAIVLVAHNGFAFDYRIMVAEVERRNQLQLFAAANLMFADTYHDLVQVVNNNM